MISFKCITGIPRLARVQLARRLTCANIVLIPRLRVVPMPSIVIRPACKFGTVAISRENGHNKPGPF